MRQHSRFVVYDGTATADFNSAVYETIGCRGVLLFLDVDSVSASDTLDIKLQAGFPGDALGGGENFFDIPGAAFVQATAAGQKMLVLYPGITESANVKVSTVLPSRWRVVFDLTEVGGGALSIAFRLWAEVLW